MKKDLVDNYKYQGLRKKLIAKLREEGFSNESVLEVMSKIPRHWFVDEIFAEHVYENKAFPIGDKQTISHPSTVAYQTDLLQLTKDDIVLEIGTGSGYQTIVLANLCNYVLTIERQKNLFRATKNLLKNFPNRNIQQFYGDGYIGLANYAPFNKIIVTCGAIEMPTKLIEQLAPGGRMIVPIGKLGKQVMHIIDKDEKGMIRQKIGKNFSFVPMLKGKNS